MPEFWRTEVFHALSVHFPIVLLLMATLINVVCLFIKSRGKIPWIWMASICLWVGTVAAWVSIFTGNAAESIVNREVCDPTMVKAHQTNAMVTGYIFLAATVIDIGIMWFRRLPLVNYIKAVVIILMFIGSGFLTYSGHLGAKLVYQQGAGVYVPSENCEEFE